MSFLATPLPGTMAEHAQLGADLSSTLYNLICYQFDNQLPSGGNASTSSMLPLCRAATHLKPGASKMDQLQERRVRRRKLARGNIYQLLCFVNGVDTSTAPVR